MTLQTEDGLTSSFRNFDTAYMDFPVGKCVVCFMGELKGLEGVVTATRTGGRLLVRVRKGMFVELPRICLRCANPPR